MKRNGFSLIETLVGLALSAFLITGTGHLLLSALRLRQRSEAVLETARQASSLLEGLRSLPFEDAALEAGDHEDRVSDLGTRLTFRRLWTIDDIDPGTKDAFIRIACDSKRVRDVCLRARFKNGLGF